MSDNDRPAVTFTSLEGATRFMFEMDERTAFENIGRASAQGHTVDMRMVKDRDGKLLLVTYTQGAGARGIYVFTGV